jgi:heptaprenyl diphosphate synthase
MTKDKSHEIDEIREILESLKKLTTVPYVEKYVDLPPLAENRLALLYFFLRDEGMERTRAKTLCVTTGLVQLGLDTHENVRVRYEETHAAERNRQLTVLAGDYFSSFYYHMLAEAGEIAAIRVLAEAIQEINEAKMTLYVAEKEDKLSSEGYMAIRQVIDTALYTSMVNHFASTPESRRFWTSLIQEMAAVECMIGAWEQLQWQEQTPPGFTRLLMKMPGTTITHVLSLIEAKATELMGACEQLVRSFQTADKQTLLDWITSRYAHRVNRLKRVVEEL